MIKQDRNQGLTVSDENIKVFNYQVLKEIICDCCNDECDQIAFPPLEIARQFAGFIGKATPLLQRLIDVGAIDNIN